MATDIHWQCRSPVKKIFDSLFRNSSLMQKIHSGLSTFGFISERDTSEPFPLHSRGSNPIPSHVPTWRSIGLVLSNSCSSEVHFCAHPSALSRPAPKQPHWSGTPQKHMAIACSASLCPSEAHTCQLCESQLPGQQHDLKNHTENQKLAYSLLQSLSEGMQLDINATCTRVQQFAYPTDSTQTG